MERRRNAIKYRILSSILAVACLFTQVQFPSRAAEESAVHIRTAEEFLLLTEQCRTESFSTGKTFYLDQDLDLSEYENLFLPVMDGTFDGNDHQITGLTLTEEVSDYGLFRYVGENGWIRNLTVEAEMIAGEDQENTGIIVGSNAGTIFHCTSRGTLSGQKSVGGIAGENKETGKILRCRNEAKIDGKEGVGGITGSNEGSISDCTNAGNINTSQKVHKELEGDGSIHISVPNAVTGLTSDERSNETGGIAGNSTGTISDCRNEGTIGYEHLGYAIGGIVGRQSGSLNWCSNEGIIYGRKNVGGIVGYFEPYEAASYDRDISEELEEELDDLSDLIDGLKNAGDRLGDDLSVNLDDLMDQMKALRSSIRNHLDDITDLSDDSREDISDQVDDVRKSLEGLQMQVDLQKLNTYIAQIEKDQAQIEAIQKELMPLMQNAGSQAQASMEQILQLYNQQLPQISGQLEALKQLMDGMLGGGESQETPDTDTSDTGTSDTDTSDTDTSDTDTSDTGTSDTDTSDTDTSKNDQADAALNEMDEDDSDALEEPDLKDSDEGSDTSDSDISISGNAKSGYIFVASTDTGLTEEQIKQQKEAQQALVLIGKLETLSADIQTQLQGITNILGTIPGEVSNLQSGFKKLEKNMGDLVDTIDDELDDWSDELEETKNDLRTHGNQASDSLDQTLDTLDADWDTLSDQLDLVKDKFSDIRATISDSFDELKSRIEDRSVYVDISDLATSETGVGKVVSCTNTGEIYADSQAGGIVGSILKVSTSDIEGWIFEQDERDDEWKDCITRHVLAAIIGCKNTSDISATDDYAGGIVGRADYGSIMSCQNYGDVVSEEGSYVGGIAGKAEHGIKDSYVFCGLDGASYVGGVAGSGEDISGSYVCAYMDMEDHVKSSGAIAGSADGHVENNYFVDNEYGAVDGVTRSGEAEAVDYAEMLNLSEMPEEFSAFTIRFMDGEENVWEGTFSYGEEFSEENYPELTKPEGEYAYWEEKSVSPVHRNVTLHAVYRAYIPSLAAGSSEEHPDVLLGGEFYPDSTLAVRECTEEEETKLLDLLKEQSLFPGYLIKNSYYYEISQEEPLETEIDLRVKDDSALSDSMAVVSDDYQLTGTVQKAGKTGSYLAINTTMEKSGYILVLDKVDRSAVVIGILIAILAAALFVGIFWKFRKTKTVAEETEDVAE